MMKLININGDSIERYEKDLADAYWFDDEVVKQNLKSRLEERRSK